MTIEQRTFISPKDIMAVEYECAHCHAKYLTPLKDFSRVIEQCPNCQKPLVHTTYLDSTKRSDERALYNFVETLRDRGGSAPVANQALLNKGMKHE